MNFDVVYWTNQIGEHARPLMAALFLFFLVSYLLRTNIAKRLRAKMEETIFASWQLALLGTTGVVLSIAAGMRTWEGMYNFTGEPVMAAMITFGIQGLMLIVAWLIGESFATGMNMQSQRSESRLVNPQVQSWIGAAIGLLLFVIGFVLFMQWTGQADVRQASTEALEWSKMGDKLLIFGFGLLVVALFALYAASDLIKPYVQGFRVVIRNSMLWVMFLACMATSVFFSFDSFFTAIFPQSERVRAAELRAQNQVAGIVADIEGVIAERNASEQQALLQSEAWTAYEKNLSEIARVASTSQGALERYINAQIEDRRRAVKDQQERMSSAQSGQAGLATKKISLTEEKSRLAGERPGLAAEYAAKKAELDAKSKEVDAKRVEALAEDKGVEGSGKQGRGPMYRQRMQELEMLQNTYKIAEERTKDAQKRLSATEGRLAAIDRELATIDGDLAKLKGEAETAEQRIKLAEETAKEGVGQKMDPSRLVPNFERTVGEFREHPSSERLVAIQSICGDIYGALQQTPETKGQLGGLDCDPKRTADAAANLWALQAGIKQFAATCSGGEKLTANKSADELFAFARRCLQDSALPSADTDALRTKINHIELSRDDKAHRFVVTWNAFQDGNRLAYLALAIAIGLDGLIFMSGLFGANAVRSPLSDVPTMKARSGAQLEATINAALGPQPYETAWITLNALRPMTMSDGFSAYCDLSGLDKATADRIRMVLTAGADIGAVETISHDPERYRVRSELREYLSIVCDKNFKTDATAKDKAQLNKLVSAALEPYPREHADIVLHTLEPIRETEGFTSIITLADITDPYDTRVVRRVLNAGATVGAVAPDKNVDDRYCIRPALYETLLNILSGSQPNPQFTIERHKRLGLPLPEVQPEPRFQGEMHDFQEQLPLEPQAPKLARPQPKLAALSQEQQQQLYAHYREELLESLGLSSTIVDLRLANPYARTAMIDAFKALSDVQRSNERLGQYLTEFQRQKLEMMEGVLGRLNADVQTDPIKQQILEAAQNRIEEDHSAYMLFPEYELLDYLISELEAAAQPDDGLRHEEQELLQQLKEVRDTVNKLKSNLADPRAWAQINDRLASRSRFPNVINRRNRET